MGDSEWRLEALCRRGAVDSALTDSLQELAGLAAHSCGMPAALLWVAAEGKELARFGFGLRAGEEAAAVEACADALRHRETTAGTHLLPLPADANAADSTLACYAASPLLTSDEAALGAVCVLDRVPRLVTVSELDTIRALGRRAAEEIRLRCRLVQLQSDLAERAHTADELDKLFHLSLDMLCVAGFDGYFKRLNEAWERALGYSVEELLARPYVEFVHPDDRSVTLRAANRIAGGENVIWFDNRYICKDGSVKWLSWAAAPAMEQKVIFAAARDTTERRLAEEALHRYAQNLEIARHAEAENATRLSQLVRELESAKTRAEKTSRTKSEFLAGMSEEIRHAMDSIRHSAEFVLKTQLTAEQLRHLGTIKDAADNLSDLTGNILDLSRIETGNLDLDRTEFHLRDTLEATVRSLALAAQEKGLELGCRIWAGVPDGLVGDPGRLRQIVLILVGNAIKFTETGEVVLQVEEESEGEEDVLLHLTVFDTGIGIPDEKRATVFDGLGPIEPPARRAGGSAGLGLALAARLVEMMHGQIWVESEAGKGSAFHVRVRYELRKGAGRRPVARKSGDLRDVRALVVDDNATTRSILMEMLAQWHMKPEGVESARAAVHAMKAAVQLGHPFTVALIDAVMPDVDGVTLTGMIRKDEHLARTAVIVLMPAGTRSDAARLQDLGVVECLTKPVRQSELLHASVRAVRGEQPAAREGAAAPTGGRANGDRAEPAEADSVRVFDLNASLQRIGGDAQLLRDLGRLFREDMPRMVARLKKAVELGDLKGLALGVHTLKGAVGNFIAPASMDAVRVLENDVRHRNLEDAPGACAALEQELSKLQLALSGLLLRRNNKRRHPGA